MLLKAVHICYGILTLLPLITKLMSSVVDPQDLYVLGLPDPDPSLFVLIRIWIFPSTNKQRKSFISTIFLLFYFLSFNYDL